MRQYGKSKLVIRIGLFSIFYFLFSNFAFASNISATSSWAWNDVIGWVDFYWGGNGIVVGSADLTHDASSSVGFISTNCSDHSYCGTSNYKVSRTSTSTVYYNATSTAVLTGFAWNDTIGWISFSCTDISTSTCDTTSYRVTIDLNGDFHGYAWNDLVGWLAFNCGDLSCPYGVHKVQKAFGLYRTYGELISSTYDTGYTGGVSYNSITWSGTLPVGTAVKFQLATATSSSGPWNYKGPDGTSSTWYAPLSFDTPISVSNTYHFGDRYFRYKLRLESNYPDYDATPIVNKVIINYSP